MEASEQAKVVKRLREARALEVAEERSAGLAAGDRWARESANPRQFRRVSALHAKWSATQSFKEYSPTGSISMRAFDAHGETAARLLAEAVAGRALSVEGVEEFYRGIGYKPFFKWSQSLGYEYFVPVSPAFPAAFAEAAAAVWEPVAAHFNPPKDFTGV